MASISIIGTPGAGKTVFLSVLAMRYRTPAQGKPWLEYRNRETQRYVSEAWDTLQNEEWPPSTPPGQFPKLEWILHGSDGQQNSLIVRDPAGQDVRAIYDSPPENHTEQQRELKRVFDSSDIILFLINLRPAMDASGNQSKIDDIEIPLKLAIQDTLKRGARVALLVTQHDIIAETLTNAGIDNHAGARAAIARYLPQVGGLLRGNTSKIGTLFIASVAETVPRFEGVKTYRRPKPGFISEGLESILAWIEGEVPVVAHEQEEKAKVEAKREQERRHARLIHERDAKIAEFTPQKNKLKLFLTATLIVSVFLIYMTRNVAFEKIHAKLFDAAVIQIIEDVERLEHLPALPSDFHTLSSRLYGKDANGDYLGQITVTNISSFRLDWVKIETVWSHRTNILKSAKSYTSEIASLSVGRSVDRFLILRSASDDSYLENLENWYLSSYKISAYKPYVAKEAKWIHDHSQDERVKAEAARGAIVIALIVSLIGFIPSLFFAIKLRQVGNKIQAIKSSVT